MIFSIGKYDVELSLRARRPLSYLRLHKGIDQYHLVWWKLSIIVEDGMSECVTLCKECGSAEVGEICYGDEGVTVCRDCNTIEGGYTYVSRRVADA